MIEQERLARRIQFCKAMGLWKPDGDTIQVMPDFDTDAEARERLLEWFTGKIQDRSVQVMQRASGDGWAVFINIYISGEVFREDADTYAEALLSAIDAAIQSRGKANE